MRETTLFNGKEFYRYPESGHPAGIYFRRAEGPRGASKAVLLHRAVWEFHNGAIPPGNDIHHRDGDPGNNRLDNLECLTKEEHKSRHRLQKICACGEAFPTCAHRPREVCTPCYERARHARRYVPAVEQARALSCIICGAGFEYLGAGRHALPKYCGDDCKKEGTNRRQQARRAKMKLVSK